MRAANRAISLGESAMELVFRGEGVEVSAAPMLRLLPHPRLVIEFEAPYSGLVHIDQIEPSAKLISRGIRLDVIPTALSCGDGTVRGCLSARREPSTALSTRRRLQSVRFSILNFQKFFGRQDEWLRGQRLGRIQLAGTPWQIDIVAVPNVNEITTELERDGGYAITHKGIVARSDRKTFTVAEVEHLLEALRLFLSFARGAFCSLTLQSGLDQQGKTIWEQWGTHVVAPWGYMPSWFDTMHGQILSKVFPGFWHRFNDPTWHETIVTALYWYLRSNTHGTGAGVDGGLILTQAALERLSYVHLGHRPGRASDLVRQALSTMRIPTNIPRSCRELRALARSIGWQDGPHAITEVRNALVHPKQKYGTALSGSFYEAWNLGQRYVELILLRLFRHNGLHANRLRTQRWRGQVVRVPWA